jgi:hypothetical protein
MLSDIGSAFCPSNETMKKCKIHVNNFRFAVLSVEFVGGVRVAVYSLFMRRHFDVEGSPVSECR